MLWYQEDKLTLDQRRRQLYCALIQTDSDVVIEEKEGDFRERCIITKGNE